MKNVNLKDQDVNVSENINKVESIKDNCACSPEFGCKNCEEEGVPQED